MDSTFLIVGVIGVLAVMSPGPDFLIVTRNSLLYYRRVGLATALGIAAGNIWWVIASVLGISLVISGTILLFNIIKEELFFIRMPLEKIKMELCFGNLLLNLQTDFLSKQNILQLIIHH